ncbi:MAG: stage III sporulation protein SpoIIIAB [Bacillota bacterium]|nr:stage III sporulation protein SpoIIIAB [Bacillota bacterium]
MIKTMGAILIIGASSVIGFIFAETLRRRLNQLKELQGALVQLQNEIFYTRTDLPEACLKVALKSKNPINTIFEKVSEELSGNDMDSVYAAFQYALKVNEGGLNLTKEDKEILLDLSKALGDSDMEGHRKIFNLAEYNIKTRIEALEQNVDKNMKMYRYLGFSAGAALAIILI